MSNYLTTGTLIDYTKDIRTTELEMRDLEGDKQRLKFITETSSISRGTSISAELHLAPGKDTLYDDEIIDLFRGLFKVILAQKDRVPELVEEIYEVINDAQTQE